MIIATLQSCAWVVPKRPFLDQKLSNTAGLPMSRCGPKGSQMDPRDQHNTLLTIWNHFRQNLIFCSKTLWPGSILCFRGNIYSFDLTLLLFLSDPKHNFSFDRSILIEKSNLITVFDIAPDVMLSWPF